MQKKSGFTLIELLAVILILSIIALIAIPTVASIIKESKKGAFEATVKTINRKIEEKCIKDEVKGTERVYEYTITDGKVTPDLELAGELPDNGRISVTDECKISSAEYSNNEFVATVTGDKIKVTDKSNKNYAAYSIGDDVTLTDGTTWVVIKDTDSTESEIKLMSTLNVKSNLTAETGAAMFTSTGSKYALAYDDNSNVWANSTLKAYLDGTVKTRLETSLNTTISDITILGVEELTALGCTVEGNDTDGYSKPVCDNTKEWYSNVIQKMSWTKLPHADYSSFAWNVNGRGFDCGGVYNGSTYGARPVITISKDVIS